MGRNGVTGEKMREEGESWGRGGGCLERGEWKMVGKGHGEWGGDIMRRGGVIWEGMG
jgi:hypothetical protein